MPSLADARANSHLLAGTCCYTVAKVSKEGPRLNNTFPSSKPNLYLQLIRVLLTHEGASGRLLAVKKTKWQQVAFVAFLKGRSGSQCKNHSSEHTRSSIYTCAAPAAIHVYCHEVQYIVYCC